MCDVMTTMGTAREFMSEDIYIPTLFAASVVFVLTIKIVGNVIRSAARERTRREIAAYIAEGSMTPEQGERLMKAGAKDA